MGTEVQAQNPRKQVTRAVLASTVGTAIEWYDFFLYGTAAALVFPKLLTWGWRIPFLLSLVLVAVGLYIRLGIMETPSFARLVQEKRIEKQPVVEAFRHGWREIFLSMFIRLSEQAPFYIFTTFVLAYGTSVLKLSRDFMLVAIFLAATLSLLTIPLAGHLSDRFGRKLVYSLGIVAVALYAIPYFGLLDTRAMALVIIAVVVSLIPHDLQYGPQASLIAESFTGRLRYSGASIGYQLASVIAGGPAPLVATYLLSIYHSSTPIAIYIIECAVISFIAIRLLPDRQRVDHTVEYDEQHAPAWSSKAVRPTT